MTSWYVYQGWKGLSDILHNGDYFRSIPHSVDRRDRTILLKILHAVVKMIPLGAGEKCHPATDHDEKSRGVSRSVENHVPMNLGCTSSKNTFSITKAAVEKAKAELQKSLKEEQMWTKLQMELLVHLHDLNASIAAAESEGRMAKLALQQAELIRLQKSIEDPQSIPEPEVISVKRRS